METVACTLKLSRHWISSIIKNEENRTSYPSYAVTQSSDDGLIFHCSVGPWADFLERSGGN